MCFKGDIPGMVAFKIFISDAKSGGEPGRNTKTCQWSNHDAGRVPERESEIASEILSLRLGVSSHCAPESGIIRQASKPTIKILYKILRMVCCIMGSKL
ncbi:hypothetical protein ES705_47696 [subsurface metagenome]